MLEEKHEAPVGLPFRFTGSYHLPPNIDVIEAHKLITAGSFEQTNPYAAKFNVQGTRTGRMSGKVQNDARPPKQDSSDNTKGS